jgi:hypothetical protein
MHYNLVIKLIIYTPAHDAMDFSKMHFAFMINMSVKIYTSICYDISLPDSIKLWEWISIQMKVESKQKSHIVVNTTALCSGCPQFNFRLGNAYFD